MAYGARAAAGGGRALRWHNARINGWPWPHFGAAVVLHASTASGGLRSRPAGPGLQPHVFRTAAVWSAHLQHDSKTLVFISGNGR